MLRAYIGAQPTVDNREVPNTHWQPEAVVIRDIKEPYYYREALWKQWNLVVARDVNHLPANLYCMSNELFVERRSSGTADSAACLKILLINLRLR
ncbi:MAG: hypothetical protein PHD91_03780 [bacterium]|jgi:hypothetical protein|nr:hypothetical protein [bacterium]MDD4152817.1 hypothetical protein [bacterium]MDD4557814.1 hypothetical protein [bacterium]